METIVKYKVIKTRKQYNTYCSLLEELAFAKKKTRDIEDEIDLLTLLIEDYDKKNSLDFQMSPVTLLQSFMQDHSLKGTHLAAILLVSPGYISDILNNKKPISKELAIQLGKYFKVEPAAFYNPVYEFLKMNQKKEVRLSRA